MKQPAGRIFVLLLLNDNWRAYSIRCFPPMRYLIYPSLNLIEVTNFKTSSSSYILVGHFAARQNFSSKEFYYCIICIKHFNDNDHLKVSIWDHHMMGIIFFKLRWKSLSDSWIGVTNYRAGGWTDMCTCIWTDKKTP